MERVDCSPPGAAAPVADLPRSAKVLALSLGNALTMIGGIVFAMVASRLLSKADYGTYRQTFLTYEFVAPLLQLGIPSALYYLLPRAPGDRKGTVIDALAMLTFAGLGFSLFLALGGGAMLARWFDNPDLATTLPWMVAYPLFMLPVAAISTILVFAERVRTLAVYTTLVSLATTAAMIAALLWEPGYEAPVIARIAVAAAALPVGLLLTSGLFAGRSRLPRPAAMRAMLRVSVPMGLAFMLGTLTLQLHSLIVAALCTPEQFAVYANGAIEVPIIGIVVGSITTVLFAEMANACAAGDKPGALALFRSAAVQAACILLPTMVYMAVAAEPFIVFLYSQAYAESVTPFTIYLLVLPPRIVVYGAALMALGLSRAVLVRSAVDLVFNAVACLVLVSAFGYNGAAMGLVATLYLWTVPYNIYKIAQGYEVRWTALLPWRTLGKVLATSAGAGPAAWVTLHLLGGAPAFLRLAASSVVFGAAYFALLVGVAGVPLPHPVTAWFRRLPLVAGRR